MKKNETMGCLHFEARFFLEAIFSTYFIENDGFIEFRLIRNKDVRQGYYDSLSRASQRKTFSWLRMANDNGFAIYFGVLPRMKRSGKEADIGAVTCLWADIDSKKFENGKEEARKKLSSFPITPSIIVDSGHGYHPYWILERMTDDLRRAKGILKGIARELNGDSTFDLSRVLRLPGTINAKPGMEPVVCRLVPNSFNPEKKYRLDEFASYFMDPGEVSPRIELLEIDGEIPTNFWAVLEHDKALRKIWFGLCKMPHDTSRSAYDMALTTRLTKYGFSNKEIASILRRSHSGKGVEATLRYIEHTIGKARNSKYI